MPVPRDTTGTTAPDGGGPDLPPALQLIRHDLAYGRALFEVYDADGGVLARATPPLGAADSMERHLAAWLDEYRAVRLPSTTPRIRLER